MWDLTSGGCSFYKLTLGQSNRAHTHTHTHTHTHAHTHTELGQGRGSSMCKQHFQKPG